MAKKIETKKATSSKEEKGAALTGTFALGKDNYMIILGGIALLVLGYVLMIGGGADSPDEFNPEIFNTQRLTVAPVTLLIGFGVVLYGIMKKPKTQE